MRALTWLPSLETGIEEIDSDHKKLLALFAQADGALTRGDAEEFRECLDQSVKDFSVHFCHEVSVLKKVGYPYADGHEAEHGAFLDTLKDLRGRCVDEVCLKALDVEFENVVSFLFRDILSSDVHFKSYLADHGVCDPRNIMYTQRD